MQTIAISQFKAHALQVLDQVAKQQEKILITKRGKPLAQIIPIQEEKTEHQPGKLASTLVFEGDIVSPLGEEIWDSTFSYRPC